MLYKVFDFASKEVSAVMVPRPEVVAISVDMPPEDALATVVDSPFTRYPVYRGLARRDRRHPARARPLRGDARPRDRSGRAWRRSCGPRTSSRRRRTSPRCSPTSGARSSTWRSSSTSTARWRGSSRSRTCSRRSSARSRTSSTFRTRPSSGSTTTHIRIDGTYTIDDFNEEFGTELEQDDFHTMAGLVFGALGRAPRSATRSRSDGLRLTVLEVEGSRIMRIEVEFGVDEDADGRARSRLALAVDSPRA